MASPLAYSGAWRAQTTYVDRALAPNPGVDPAHMRRDVPDPGQVPTGHPRADYAPMYLTEDTDDSYRWEVDTPGVELDFEPITHDPHDPEIHHPAPIPGAEPGLPSITAHAIDRGVPLLNNYTPKSQRASDERWITERWEQPAVQGDLTVSALRGTNSLRENNPDGYRLGWSHKRYIHRELPHERYRHDERPIHPVVAGSAVQSPAMSADEANRYVSPFSWNARARGALLLSPFARRTPVSASETVITDGTEDVSEVPGDWVVG